MIINTIDIKKIVKKNVFFSSEGGGGKIWMENYITFNVFLLKPSLNICISSVQGSCDVSLQIIIS